MPEDHAKETPPDDRCPQCAKPLPQGCPRGLCPACLLKRGLETNTVGYTAGAERGGCAAWTLPTVEQLAPLFAELDIIELIGRGGMGAVYKAREKHLDRIVALKILPPEIGRDPAFAERFMHEAQAMAKLGHPNIVTIHSFGQRTPSPSKGECKGEGVYFFIMEYVDGLSLRQLLDAGTIAPKEALAIVPQICDALQYAHDRGIVHRDIKPENILLNRAGQVKIADFGLAKLVGRGEERGAGASRASVADDPSADSSFKESKEERGQVARDTCGQGVRATHNATQKVMGTPQYMAPEQIEHPREVDHRADIYSLGVVFYQMLTGELPKGKFGEAFEPPSRKVVIDVRLDEVVLRALEREPSRRYQQVSEVKTQVETIVGSGMGVSPVSTTAVPPVEAAKHGQDARDTHGRDGHAALDRAHQAVKAPAIGMMIAAGMNLLLFISVFATALIAIARILGGGVDLTYGLYWWQALAIPGLFLNGLVLWGAIRMMQLRNRGLAITAAIMALLVTPANLIGLPFGIWALVVLSRREVADAFAAERAGEPTIQQGWRKRHHRIPLVGVRDGRRVIHWPGLLIRLTFVGLGVSVMAIGGAQWPTTVIVALALVAFIIMGILRGWAAPVAQLITLDSPSTGTNPPVSPKPTQAGIVYAPFSGPC